MRFKINDYVKIIEGFIPEEFDQPVYGWQGKIIDVRITEGGYNSYLVAFDAQTLDLLQDDYLVSCLEEGDEHLVYYFLEEDLELTTRRDTDAMLKAAVAKIEARMEELDDEEEEDEEEEMNETLLEEWVADFLQSPEFAAIPDEFKDLAEDAPRTFARFAFDYEWSQVGEWVTSDVEMVCLSLVPRKVTAEPAFFKHFGTGLTAFFKFLDREKLLENAKVLAKAADKAAPKIAKRAADSSNWGMAKSFAMMAMQSGVDPTDGEQMGGFLNAYNANLAKNIPPATSQERPSQPDPFRHIGRNDVIKVQYPDGTVITSKFKKVEHGLRNGKCTLVK